MPRNGSKKSAAGTAAPQASANDTIAKNRTVTFIGAEELPPVPKGYQKTRAQERRQRLRLMAESLIPLATQALEGIVAKGPETVRQELGDLAPNTSGAEELLTRVKRLGVAINHLEKLTSAYQELEDIALSDTLVLLEGLHGEYAHRAPRIAELATEYSHLVAFFEARSAAISAGMARKERGGTEEETETEEVTEEEPA